LTSLTTNGGGGTTNFSYDSAGNMTAANSTSYQWDAASRLKSVNNGSLGSYGYDGNGKRVKKTESGTTTYDVVSSVLGSTMEVTSAGMQRAYVMSGSAVVAQLNPNGQFYWLHLDHLGSGRKMTDSSGNMTYRAEFDPYGKLLYEWSSPANLNTKKFTGYERDAGTGLDYAQARMYASDWGRFLTPDPLGLRAARLNSPKSLNRYSYVESDPVNFVDRTGTQIRCWDGIPGLIGDINGSIILFPTFCRQEYSKAGDSGGGGGGGDVRGGGGGQGAAATRRRNEIISKLQETTTADFTLAGDFLAQNPDCITEFEKANGGLDLDEAFKNLSIYDSKGIDKDDRNFWNTKPKDIGDIGPDSNRTFGQLIGPTSQGQAIALWTLPSPMIIIGQNVLFDRSRLIVHEMLHIYFKAGHVDIANKLKLSFNQGKSSEEAEANASAAINDFIKGGCKR
jgi:RHS repeat-associated protein